jgi:hypothetical protein
MVAKEEEVIQASSCSETERIIFLPLVVPNNNVQVITTPPFL